MYNQRSSHASITRRHAARMAAGAVVLSLCLSLVPAAIGAAAAGEAPSGSTLGGTPVAAAAAVTESSVPQEPSVVPTAPPDVPAQLQPVIPCTYTQVTYCIRTKTTGLEKGTTAVFGTPVPVDVDGNGTPDVVVLLAPGAPGVPGSPVPDAQLLVTRLGSDHLPLLLEAILAVGQPGEMAVFGYDTHATGRSAPARFEAKLTVVPGATGAPGGADISVIVDGAPDQLDLTGYRGALAGAVSARARFSPVPANLNVVVQSSPPTGKVTVVADRVTRLTAWLDASSSRLAASAVVDELPTDGLELTWDTAAKRVSYGTARKPSSARARSLSFDVKQHALEGGVALHVLGRLDNPGTTMTLAQDGPSRYAYDSSPAAGQVEMGVAANGTVQVGPATGDYVKLVGAATSASMAARITGLSHVVLERGDPLRIEVKHARVPLTLFYNVGSRVVTVAVDALPAQVDLRYWPSEQKVEYQGSDVIDRITVDASDPAGLLDPAMKEAHLVLKGLPTSLTFQYVRLANGASRIVYDSPNATAAVELGLATNSPVQLGPATGDYVKVVGAGSVVSLAARITGLSHVVIESGEPLRIEVRHARVPLTLYFNAGGRAATVAVDALPANVDLKYWPSQQKVEYEGSDVIGRITADASDPTGLVNGKVTSAHVTMVGLPATVTIQHMPLEHRVSYRGSGTIAEISTDVRDAGGLVGRAKKITALARTLPPKLELVYGSGAAGTAYSIEAKDDAGNLVPVGLVQALLTSGPEDPLPAHLDGVRVVDLPDSWMAFARVTGLKRAAAERVRTCQSEPFWGAFLLWRCVTTASAALDTVGGRNLQIDVSSQSTPGGKVNRVLATLHRLAPTVALTSVDDSTAIGLVGAPAPDSTATHKSRVTYGASATSDLLTIWTNEGREVMTARLEPVPRSLQLCQAKDNACVGNISPADKGTTSLFASETTRLYVHDCEKRVGGSCWVDYTEVDLTFRTLRVGVHQRSDGFRMFLDTDGHGMHGRVRKLVGGTVEYDLRFPNVSQPLWAQDRDSIVSCGAFYCSGSNRGQIHCPSNTAFDINTHHWRWGIANFAEEIC